MTKCIHVMIKQPTIQCEDDNKRKNERRMKENGCINIFNLLAETRITIAELCEAERDDENGNHFIFPILFWNVLLLLFVYIFIVCWKLRFYRQQVAIWARAKKAMKWNDMKIPFSLHLMEKRTESLNLEGDRERGKREKKLK